MYEIYHTSTQIWMALWSVTYINELAAIFKKKLLNETIE
jgi:hypothetical protein